MLVVFDFILYIVNFIICLVLVMLGLGKECVMFVGWLDVGGGVWISFRGTLFYCVGIVL